MSHSLGFRLGNILSKERQDQVRLFRVRILFGLLSHRAEIETGSFRPDRQPQDSGCKVQKISQAGLEGSGQSGQDWISPTQTQLSPVVQLLQLLQVH